MSQPKAVAPDSPGARKLIALSDEYLAALYPPESNHLESIEALQRPNVRFMGIELAGELVACGAVKLMNNDGEYGEIKRVFVLPECRGRGYARSIMASLEGALRDHGILLARLETGISQPEALSLYRALGYLERGPFGSYRLDPWSVFMQKTLTVSEYR